MFYFVAIASYAFPLAKVQTTKEWSVLVTPTLIPTSLLHRAAANNQAPAVLSGLHNELECYIAEISASSDVECGLTF